jgi:nucleotide-binding universal stress UspA family protein
MSAPRRLLVATDFSAGAACAADTAIRLAESWKAEIDWVHVGQEASHALTPSSDALLAKWVDHQHHEARVGLETLQKEAREQGVESAVHIQAGRPDVAVAKCAEAFGSDLVVVGTHGRSGIQSLLIGSVAEKIVRNSPVSVLCVRPGVSVASGGTVVFGEDFGSPERRKQVAEQVRALGAHVIAVHSVELSPAVMADSSFSPPPALLESSVSEARERMGELAGEYGPDAETAVCLGNASDSLCDQARRRNASLIVTGTGSRSGIERWMLGSVAEKTLRHAPCSVLVLK